MRAFYKSYAGHRDGDGHGDGYSDSQCQCTWFGVHSYTCLCMRLISIAGQQENSLICAQQLLLLSVAITLAQTDARMQEERGVGSGEERSLRLVCVFIVESAKGRKTRTQK